MSLPSQTILIHSAAPSKPAEGAPCNGCGVCCLAEPCPLGVVLSGHRHGACKALRWQDAGGIYRCGAISEPAEVLVQALPSTLRVAAPFLAPVLGRLARRWIAAGIGCDSSLQPGTHPDLTDNSTR
ncbi:MAG TPA: hypothetical protein PKH04_02340 [Burkholderiaceae bacterium]|nr:hypothetical protein [Rhodoferax sp.]HNW00885.1 hypothetical protein [Burkholderiaceae bacterium]HPW06772.1 hypothetical protein [Burkholderiaceae bacterium]